MMFATSGLWSQFFFLDYYVDFYLFLFYCCYYFFSDSIKKLQGELKGLNKELLEKNATTEELREKSVMLQHECTVKTNSISEVTQQKNQLEQQCKVRVISNI